MSDKRNNPHECTYCGRGMQEPNPDVRGGKWCGACERSLSVMFHRLRHDPNHHLGLGDVRLTIGQQEELVALFDAKERLDETEQAKEAT